MDVNCYNAKPVEDAQPSVQALVARKRSAKQTFGDVEWLAKRSDLLSNNAVLEDVDRYFSRLGETAGTSGTSKPVFEVAAAAYLAWKGPSEAAQGYSPMDEAARREWVDRKCAEDEERLSNPMWHTASEKASRRKHYEEELAAVERWFLAEIHANTDADGKASVQCDLCEEIDGLPPNERVKELVVQSTNTGLEEKFLHALPRLFPKMRALTIEIEDVWFLRWTTDINYLCEILEDFLRTADTIEHIRFVVLDKPGVAVKSFKGFRREAGSASIQGSSHNIFGRRFY